LVELTPPLIHQSIHPSIPNNLLHPLLMRTKSWLSSPGTLYLSRRRSEFFCIQETADSAQRRCQHSGLVVDNKQAPLSPKHTNFFSNAKKKKKKKKKKYYLHFLQCCCCSTQAKERGLVGWIHILAAPLIAHSSTLGFFYNVSTLRSSASDLLSHYMPMSSSFCAFCLWFWFFPWSTWVVL
jgi:hypothetical protein